VATVGLGGALSLALIASARPGQDPPQPKAQVKARLKAQVKKSANGLGYTTTPYLPGGAWRVHDGDRPQPRKIDPGTASTAETPGTPPSDAVVLFDGTDLSHWRDAQGNPTRWVVRDGAMVCVPRSGMIYSKEEFGDCQIHIEFATPGQIEGSGQGRGNSGVFPFGRYEIQVLDSFDNPTYPDGQAAAIYGQYPPLVNASRKPGEWQSYDILFTAPRFREDGTLERPAHATVLHNGVVVHNHAEVLGPMAHQALPQYRPHPPKGPLALQDHGNPIRFRNIWVRDLKGYDQP
jgi:hypothetical protein